jgi:YegS/Rv2252/BmrU family lipid kinase
MDVKEKFLLVINPISGGNDKSDMVGEVKDFAAEAGVELVEYETTGKDDQEKIKSAYKEHKPSRILVAGGDGTIKMVAEAVEDHDVIIGVLPAGSANGLSVDLNLPKSLEENIAIAFHGKAMEMDMISINGKRSLHLSDIGLNAELIRNYESGSVRGKLGYALQIINTLTDLDEPFQVKVDAGDIVSECKARMVVIANTNKYGTGVTINPIGKMDDGKFEIVILKNLDIIILGKILSGNIPVDKNDDVEIISAKEAVITTNVPVSFQVDGEFCGEESRLDIKILHRQMKVAVP